jgi:hypothetical protein
MVTAAVSANVGGSTHASITARTAHQYPVADAGAFASKVHEAGSSLGTKNAARRPTVLQ